jgi:hypothetical protein
MCVTKGISARQYLMDQYKRAKQAWLKSLEEN